MSLPEHRAVARKRRQKSRSVADDSFEFQGGLNLLDPPLVIQPGQVIASENYEIGVQGGYERIGGYELYDGRDSPSDETYHVLPFRYSRKTLEERSNLIQPGQQIMTQSDVAFGTILEVKYLTGGNHLVLTQNNLSAGASLLINSFNHSGISAESGLPADPRIWPVRLTGTALGLGASHTGFTVPTVASKFTEQAAVAQQYYRRQVYDQAASQTAIWRKDHFLTTTWFLKYGTQQHIWLGIGNNIQQIDDGSNFAAGPPGCVIDLKNGTISAVTGGLAPYFEDVDYERGVTAPNAKWRRIIMPFVGPTSDQDIIGGQCYLFLVTIRTNADGTPNLADRPTTVTNVPAHLGDASKFFFVAGPNHYDSLIQAEAELITPYLNGGFYLASPGPVDDPDTWSGLGYLVYYNSLRSPYINLTPQAKIRDSNGTDVCLASGLPGEKNAPDLATHLRYLAEVADIQRLLITKLGTEDDNPVTGVWFYNGVAYAFKKDTAAGEDLMYKSTSSGWVVMTPNRVLQFGSGNSNGPFLEGQTVTGLVSGASAPILRVNVTNSDWAGGVGKGRVILGTITGGPFNTSEALQVSAVTYAQSTGADFEPPFVVDGIYEFVTYNFFGASDKRRMYFVTSTTLGLWEYDSGDDVLSLYRTGLDALAPTHISAHLYMLFLSYPGGSIQNSGVGRPAEWTVVSGSAEIAVGDEVAGFLAEVGDSLFIFTRDQTYQLNGKTVATFDLQRFDPKSGAKPGSIQRIGMGIHLDDRGFQSLVTTDRFGNYESNSFSRQVQTLIADLIESVKGVARPIASVIMRAKNRYRCFFTKATGTVLDETRFLSIGVDGQEITGILQCDYGLAVTAACSEEDTDGTERIFFGTGGDNSVGGGGVYEAEKGTSFNGLPIRAGLRLASHHSGAPDRNKRYRRVRTEALLSGRATVLLAPTYEENSPDKNVFTTVDITSESFGMNWDDGHEWELFNWDDEVDSLKPAHLESIGDSIALAYEHNSAEERPHTLRGVNIVIAGRRTVREGRG